MWSEAACAERASVRAKEVQGGLGSLLDEYAAGLGVPVRLEPCDAPPRWPRPGRALWLCPLLAPFATGWLFRRRHHPTRTLASVGGVPLPPGRRAAWDPQAIGVWGSPVYDGEGQLACLVRDTQVLVLFDVLGQDAPLASLLTRKVLDLALPAAGSLLPILLGISPLHLAEQASRLARATEAEAVRSRAVSRSLERQGSGGAPGQEVRELEASRAVLCRQLTAAERRLLAAERRQAELEAQRRSRELLASDFDRIAGLPGVAAAWPGTERLHFYTEPVTAEHAGRRFLLGRFRVDVHFDGRVILRNLTHRLQGYDHPHVESGRPCLGNIQEGLRQLIARREFPAVASLLLLYLHAVNPSDWRKPVSAWPEARPRA